MEIYLIRHPKPIIKKGICYGQSDLEIKDDSLKNLVEKINKFIPDPHEQIIYSSDLKRCRMVSENIGVKHRIIYSSKIREINFGKWEMKQWSEISKDELNLWMEDFVNQNCHGGESYKDLYTRTIEFWRTLIKEKHSKTIVITHSGVIRSIICYILKIPLINSFKINIDFSGISEIGINTVDGKKSETILFINK